MGVKRLAREKLFNTEKLGIEKKGDINISAVMKPALVSATQHREGHKLITDMVFDFGAAAAALKTQSIAVNDPIGDVANANNDSYLCQFQQSVFGVITSVESICLEAFSDGTMDNVDLVYGDNDGYLGSDASNDASFASNAQEDIMGDVGQHTISTFDSSELDTDGSSGKYLYLVAGLATTKRASCTIELDGVTDVSTIISGMTAIRLLEEDGSTAANFVADSGTNWDGAAAANKFGIGNTMDNKYKLTQAISVAIHGHDSGNHFSTDAASRSAGSGNSVTTITVTRTNTAATTTENTENTLVDGYTASGITITDFSGGIPNSITSGKLLIRVTGFVAPDDL